MHIILLLLPAGTRPVRSVGLGGKRGPSIQGPHVRRAHKNMIKNDSLGVTCPYILVKSYSSLTMLLVVYYSVALVKKVILSHNKHFIALC